MRRPNILAISNITKVADVQNETRFPQSDGLNSSSTLIGEFDCNIGSAMLMSGDSTAARQGEFPIRYRHPLDQFSEIRIISAPGGTLSFRWLNVSETTSAGTVPLAVIAP